MKLTLDLIPASQFYNNVRAIVSKSQWNAIRNSVVSAVYNACEICNIYYDSLDCHEKWSYDDKKLIQKLEGMMALCKDCHQVKHFGLAEIQGKRTQALAHLMKINNISKIKAESYVKSEFEIWAARSQKSYTLDLSYLENYRS